MKCPDCGFENKPDKKYCTGCGSHLELRCPECDSVVEAEEKFCGECGRDLKKLMEAEQVDYSEPQSYTPKHLADKILADRSAIEGERKLVTVLFADVANYTAMSDKLDPEETHQIMDGCFKILMDEIHKCEGTINQFTGDGVMALFGAPVAHEDHVQRACHAALSIQKAIEFYGQKIERECGVEFRMRIGLNSGNVIVGSIGDDLRMDYTAVGDTTNLAARMESGASPGSIFVSQNTHRVARDYFEFAVQPAMRVKGKEEPQDVFKLIKPSSQVATRFEASVAKGLTRFVGRKNSMTALMEACEKVQSGLGQIVGVVGEAGVGKSRLLLEFRNRLAPHSYAYYEGRCLHYGESIIYMPILDILRSYFGLEENDREFIIQKKIREKISGLNLELERNTPAFQELFSLQVKDKEFLELEPQQKRERIFDAIRDLFIQGSRDKPLILAIEDLHWIDKTSEEFLDYFIEWLANARIMLVLLYRTEYRHLWGSKTYYNRIGLDQLGAESSAELVKAMLEGGEIVPELKNLILNRSAGNPLFMEEFTHTLLENGSIQKKADQYVLSGDVSDIQVPDTIQGIIAARMDRLEENLKRTMQVASVIGREFAFRILQNITEMREDLKRNLLNLQGLEFIYEKNLFPELEYIFKHALTQEVAYNSLLEKRRREIHGNIGMAIEDIYAERLEEFYEMLAYHYSKSDNLRKAFDYLKQSGIKATKNYSPWQAFRFHKDACKAIDRLPGNEYQEKEKLENLSLMTIPMRLLGYPEDSLEFLLELGRLLNELGDEIRLTAYYGEMSSYYNFKGDISKGKLSAEASFESARKSRNLELMAPLAADLSISHIMAGDPLKLIDVASSVIESLEENGRETDFFGLPFNLYSMLNIFHGLCMSQIGRFDEGEISCEKSLRSSTQLGDLISLGVTETFYSFFLTIKGEGISAKEHSKKSIGYFEEAQWPLLLGFAWSCSGFSSYICGDFDEAQKQLEKGLQIQSNSPVILGLSIHNWLLSIVLCDAGDLEKAQKHAETAVQLARTNDEKSYLSISKVWLGRIIGKIDIARGEEAESHIKEGMATLKEHGIKTYHTWGRLALGELYLDMGRKSRATKHLREVEKILDEAGSPFWLQKTQEVLARI